MDKKIMVTGAAGFIGSHTVVGLLERGDKVNDIINNFCDHIWQEAWLLA